MPKNKLDKLLDFMKSKNMEFNVGRKGNIHLHRDKIADDFRAFLEANGGRLSDFYGTRMVQRPSFIDNSPSHVELNKPDKVLFEPRGRYDDQSMSFRQRYKEPDSVQVVMKTFKRRSPMQGYRRPTERQLYVMEGAIRELPGYKVSDRMLERLNDSRFKDDLMGRLYWPLKNSGAGEEANSLLDNVKRLYGIEFIPGSDPYIWK